MKKIIQAAALGFGILLSGVSDAQVTVSSPTSGNSGNDARYFRSDAATAKTAKKMEIANARAHKDFDRKFDTKSTVSWAQDGGMILASYKENGVTTRVTYKNNGRWFRTIKTYDGALLRKSAMKQVKAGYGKYQIKFVNEVFEPGFHCYFVSVQKEKDYKQLIVYEGNVWIHDQFTHQ
ncbi:MAG: hypothetical protein EOO04_01105 [Chitinophagaceae bacterium]|nr:MAG: hypothetical protein EOO04_01105 [Chitinophagaceae bacterium]